VKLKIIITGLLILTLLAGSVAAITDNKDLPTKKEVKNFVNSFEAKDDFITEISETAKEEHPDWKWDIWNNGEMISFYYKTGNGYGSIYYDEDGTRIKPECGVEYKATKSYFGED
jgi:hypothetical protein